MISGSSGSKNIQRDPQDRFDDNYLARLFAAANQRSLSTTNAESFDIYQEQSETYVHSSHEPSDALRKKLEEDVGGTKIFHKSLIDVHRSYGFFNYIKFHYRKTFLKDKTTKIIATNELVPCDWSFYLKYKKIYKKSNKKYISDFLTYSELFFKDKANKKQAMFYEIWLLFLGLWISLCIFLWSSLLYQPGQEDTAINTFINGFKLAINSVTVVAIIFLLFPYCLFLIMWFNNITQLHTSKNFHFFVIGSTFLAYLLFATCGVALISYHVLEACYDLYLPVA